MEIGHLNESSHGNSSHGFDLDPTAKAAKILKVNTGFFPSQIMRFGVHNLSLLGHLPGVPLWAGKLDRSSDGNGYPDAI